MTVSRPHISNPLPEADQISILRPFLGIQFTHRRNSSFVQNHNRLRHPSAVAPRPRRQVRILSRLSEGSSCSCSGLHRPRNRNNMDLGVLPAFHLTLAFLPFKVLRAASQIDPAGSGEMFRTGAVAQYRAMLCSSHALGASMVAHIENHVPSRSWEHLVDTLETGQLADDHNDGPDEFADLFRAMCESDAFLDFRYQS